MVDVETFKVAEWPDGSFIKQGHFEFSIDLVLNGAMSAHCGLCGISNSIDNLLSGHVYIHEHQIQHMGQELASLRAQLEALIHGRA